MPTNLTDASSWDTATAPIASDIRNAASVQTALQSAANRARFLYDRLTPLADLNALRAIASPPDGLVRLVEGYGLYVFDSSIMMAEAAPWLLQPTVGSGNWHHVNEYVKGVPDGLATLDSGGKVLEPVPNRIVATDETRLTGNVSTSSTTPWQDMIAVSVPGCIAGDVLMIDASFRASTSANTANVSLRVLDSTEQPTGEYVVVGTTGADYSFAARYVVANTGTVTVKLQAHMVAAGTLTLTGNTLASGLRRSAVRVLAIRP